MDIAAVKSERLLQIYSKLVDGEGLKKKELAQLFHVTERSIQRDMETLHCFFAEEGLAQDVVYDRRVCGYRMDDMDLRALKNSEILVTCKILLERHSMRQKDRFQEGEFRNRVQFMYGGKLERIKFQYTGPSMEAVLDRLSTAEVVEQTEGGGIVKAEVFGKRMDMWLRNQGDNVKTIYLSRNVGQN